MLLNKRNKSKKSKNKILLLDKMNLLTINAKNNSKGWDGRYRGQPASAGAYVYIVDLKNGTKAVKGSLLLIRQNYVNFIFPFFLSAYS